MVIKLLANNLRQQAAKMASEGRGLLAESERLLKDSEMDPFGSNWTVKQKEHIQKKLKLLHT